MRLPHLVNLAPTSLHLVDTSAVILIVRLKVQASPTALLPFIVSAELLTGVHLATNRSREIARLEASIGASQTVFPTQRTVDLYAQNAARLQSIGRAIPTNDLWVAAMALKWDLPVLTDDAHFARVPGLKVLRAR